MYNCNCILYYNYTITKTFEMRYCGFNLNSFLDNLCLTINLLSFIFICVLKLTDKYITLI